MIRINDIIDKILEHHPDESMDLVERAYVYSARVHAGQVRLSGEPYLSHPLEVAYILADMHMDVEGVAAALLHDVVEDTRATIEEVKEMFGPAVAHLVFGVTKLAAIPSYTKQARQAESIRQMILAMADDIRVILIKLADRLHNMRTLQYHKSREKQVRIAQETLDIYTPLAARLGIYWMKSELEDTAFKYVDPEAFENITNLLSRDQKTSDHYIKTVKGFLQDKMDEAKIPCEILGRFKHIYSIHQKMRRQNLTFDQVYDIIAFRIIVDTKTHCYETLGIVHSLWKPIAQKFKDYIGVPKPNMYQSLHTTVIGPFAKRVEIQIRTREMDEVAKSGVAAHWGYKEGKKLDEDASQRFAWLQNLVENQKEYNNPDEFLENVRIDLFPEEVYIFTPKGDIKNLPRGATPVDFAYLIHSEVGNQCAGAKVNGRMVPIQYELQTGDIVDIVKGKNQHPSKDWLNFVKTVKARSRIRQWIKAQEKERSLTLGREMLEKAFRKHRLNFADYAKDNELAEIASRFGFSNSEDLIASVGYGKITPLQVIRKIQNQDDANKGDSFIGKLLGKVRKKPKEGVTVMGMNDILIRFGKCCQPIPGDPIVGYITLGHGVTVHRTNCKNALKMSPERQVDVQWWTEDKMDTFPVNIRVLSRDFMGLLAELAASISKTGANILNARSDSGDKQKDDLVKSDFTIAVESTRHLNQVFSAIRKVKTVQSVERIEI